MFYVYMQIGRNKNTCFEQRKIKTKDDNDREKKICKKNKQITFLQSICTQLKQVKW